MFKMGRKGRTRLSYSFTHIVVWIMHRLHRLKKKLKDELEEKNTIQEYMCPNFGRRYNALDALRLMSMEDEYFHCENCNGELVADSDKQESKMDGDSSSGFSEDKKSAIVDEKQSIQDEYVKAYYAAVLKQQEELEAARKQEELLAAPNRAVKSQVSIHEYTKRRPCVRNHSSSTT